MVKKTGNVDILLYRKRRNDKGKKRKLYRGKPCKHKKRYYKKSTIGNKTGLWMRAYWRVPMSVDGYLNWKYRLRSKLYKEVTNMKMSPTFRNVPFELINTKEKFEDFFAMNLWEDKKLGGKFVIMGGSHAKNKTHFKPVPIATIQVKSTPDGNVARITHNKRLSRYKWFYKG